MTEFPKIIPVDLNCDMGEGIGNDEAIMPFISSANIACGYHAGDKETMKRTIELCLKYNVAIGAHPSFFDRENFGRKNQQLSHSEILDLVSAQIFILNEIAKTFNVSIHHVKPHGALYNMSAQNAMIADAIALAVKRANENLVLFGLSGSELIKEAKKLGLKTASEVFADRTYRDDGSLTPRTETNALIEDVNVSAAQALEMINQGIVISTKGKRISIIAETICLHGDGNHAVEFAKAIYDSLKNNNIDIKAI